MSVRACVFLQNSSVQPWFHLIQFPSNPLSGQSCPLSFLHPDNFIFYVSLVSSLLWADPAVHSAFRSCNSPSFLCTSLSLCSLPTPPISFPSSLASQLYDVAIDDVLDLVMSPSPLPHRRLYWPITPLHSLIPLFPAFSLILCLFCLKVFCSSISLSSFLLPNPIFWHLLVIKLYKVYPLASYHYDLTFFFLPQFGFVLFHLCYPWKFSILF